MNKIGIEMYWTFGSVPVETYSRNWIWPRSIFIIGRVWPWNWYCTHINLYNVILWGIIPICKIFAKTWHCLFCFGACYSFWPFALTRECALHLRSIFIIGRVWPWNWYCTHINLYNVILWGIIPICKIFAKTWHCLFCFGACYSFLTFRVN